MHASRGEDVLWGNKGREGGGGKYSIRVVPMSQGRGHGMGKGRAPPVVLHGS